MTNYNERLDEALERYRLFANMAYSEVEDGFRTADEFKDVALPKVLDEAKQALTSLIKELVEESKPEIPGATSWLQAIKKKAFEDAIREYEQNLLKALEEK